jgi:hypothetical protein
VVRFGGQDPAGAELSAFCRHVIVRTVQASQGIRSRLLRPQTGIQAWKVDHFILHGGHEVVVAIRALGSASALCRLAAWRRAT